MDTIVVALGERSYPIHVGPGLLDQSDLYGLTAKQILVVTNEVVAPVSRRAPRARNGTTVPVDDVPESQLR